MEQHGHFKKPHFTYIDRGSNKARQTTAQPEVSEKQHWPGPGDKARSRDLLLPEGTTSYTDTVTETGDVLRGQKFLKEI